VLKSLLKRPGASLLFGNWVWQDHACEEIVQGRVIVQNGRMRHGHLIPATRRPNHRELDMSLVEELSVSLKDFLPPARSHLINHEGHPVAVVSDRLYQKLSDYAEKNRMTIRAVIDKLRAEIYAAP
jgi:hypothetical protein